MSLSQLFKNNYEYLNTVAKRITRCTDYRQAPELLNETYLNLNGKEYPTDNEEFVKWFSKHMKNYFVWPNSSFNKIRTLEINVSERQNAYERERYSKKTNKHFISNSGVGFCEDVSILDNMADEDAFKAIEIQVEETNDFTKELFEISSCLGKIKTLKYIELVEFKKSLPSYENILFELYFEKELSTRDIADMYSNGEHKMNYQSVNQMVNIIKSKLKTYKWKS